jgi:phospholipid/cholesterol/gamma-HCH transport system permease protein
MPPHPHARNASLRRGWAQTLTNPLLSLVNHDICPHIGSIMSELADFAIQDGPDGNAVLALSGPYLVSSIGYVDAALRKIDEPIAAIDLSQVTEIDTVGAWIACRIAEEHQAEITGTSERAQRLINAVVDAGNEADMVPPDRPIWRRVPEDLGQWISGAAMGLLSVVGFLGQILISCGSLIRHPGRFRGRALIRQMELVGVDALPIIGLMSFLIGIVIAQQGAVQLAQFGAETLTINLVGRITLRELGVLMTAIMVAGRSGSAFAAQIGTMRLTEEVDAMRTIGISPSEALVIPRILSAVLMMPLLGFYASVMAIIGGAVVGDMLLGIPFWTFLERVKEVVPTFDLWVGLIKAPIFGLIIGLAGCYHGMQVRGNSEEVGKRTTFAVVSAIFAVIVLDAFFAVFFTEIGWG